MNSNSKYLDKEIKKSTAWSFLGSLLSKISAPILLCILARILTPADFGFVSIVTMVISFADVLSDAGVFKYLIYKEFTKDDDVRIYFINGFSINIIFSFIVYLVLFFTAPILARLFSEIRVVNAIRILGLQVIVKAVSITANASLQRSFKFKLLFVTQLINAIFPTLIAIMFSLTGIGAWALILGNLIASMISAIVQINLAKPEFRFLFSFGIVLEIMKYSSWSIVESISIWLTVWVDVIILGLFFPAKQVGLYRTAITTVNSIIGLFNSAIIPVAYSALSRMQNDIEQFRETFYDFQKKLTLFSIPIGIAFLFYDELITRILLGHAWSEAASIMRIAGLFSCFMSIFTIGGDALRAFGLPKVSFKVQLVHLLFVIPVCILGAKLGFTQFYYLRMIIRIELLIAFVVVLKRINGYSIISYMKRTWYIFLCSGFVLLFDWIFMLVCKKTIMTQLLGVVLSAIVYILSLLAKRDERNVIINLFI